MLKLNFLWFIQVISSDHLLSNEKLNRCATLSIIFEDTRRSGHTSRDRVSKRVVGQPQVLTGGKAGYMMSLYAMARRVEGAIRRRIGPGPDSYLRYCKGVIHVGANSGQERDLYESYRLSVVWIEPIPEVYAQLLDHVSGFDRQTAINHLVTDQDDKHCVLHVANNNGASSSILDLHHHRDIWPEVEYARDIRLKTITLPTAMKQYAINPGAYDALVLDTQGS